MQIVLHFVLNALAFAFMPKVRGRPFYCIMILDRVSGRDFDSLQLLRPECHSLITQVLGSNIYWSSSALLI